MTKENLSNAPFSINHRGKEYYLCVKKKEGNNYYFFTTNISNLPEGSQQTALPDGYEVSTARSLVILKKKSL